MAVRNPWLKQKNRLPRYERPPVDPLERRINRKFSVSPQAVDAVKNLKSKIARQRNTSADNVYVAPQLIAEELKPYILSRRLGELDGDYSRRAMQRGMLTDIELKFLIQQEMGYIGSPDTKGKVDAHEKRAQELRDDEYAEHGQMVEMRPFLINISWTYGGSESRRGKRGSPPVKYSIEGVFYGWDAEETMEAAREFLMDQMSDASSYKAKAIMDIGEFDIAAEPVSSEIVGAMETSGEAIRKRYADVVADDRFTTKVNAFFEHPDNRRVYTDKEFGYSDSVIRYRWSGRRIVMD